MLATNPDTASGGTGTSGTGGTPTSGSGGASTGGSGSTTDVIINPQPFTPDLAWPTDLLLDRHKSNWEEWNRRLNLIIDQRNFFHYLDGSFPCPDPAGPSQRAARDVYDALRKMHENFGLHPQVHIMREALDLRFSFATPLNLSRTLNDIDRLHDKFTKMGKMDDDKLKIILIMNALKTHPQLQYTIDELLESSPAITSADIEGRILREEQLLRHREKLGVADNIALAAVANKTRQICANCKRSNHRPEFCVAPGGNMAGKTIGEARAAQKAAAAKSQTRGNRNTNSQSANVTQTPTSTTEAPKSTNTITINGKRYMLVSDSASTATACGAATPQSKHIADESLGRVDMPLKTCASDLLHMAERKQR
ncbi:hypothetical protein EDB92DRAFT_1813816 [Lactarius akahatsu]|uniref:Gag protein n=1 Tax=Lactarius akahatsu TaxID=416441 RepID=A0AAD4QDR4_9AGAM|nr:hypothetical protein EDB92DRAFT_1813816 [Lactarius akahatsu]